MADAAPRTEPQRLPRLRFRASPSAGWSRPQAVEMEVEMRVNRALALLALTEHVKAAEEATAALALSKNNPNALELRSRAYKCAASVRACAFVRACVFYACCFPRRVS